ncbi:hypothetical protein [Candidatus Stoquefichus sp. SB1]|jgi:hypothetical protein|uniref:hypothetical protein n=1 Tax=Candidatus Stoquefichus sp. SB1 TaxID=1658109 RepID=UPI00067F1068|nr:hypothetical protein [Candidatus Stoquefichus sp. SB1]
MKKIIFVLLVGMLCVSVQAKSQEPKYKIIANSNQESDIKEMYKIKDQLLLDFKQWVKGVDNKDQVLADHQSDYHATFKQGVYKIILGEGKGKTLSGELKVNYCESTEDIETKSFLFDWLF